MKIHIKKTGHYYKLFMSFTIIISVMFSNDVISANDTLDKVHDRSAQTIDGETLIDKGKWPFMGVLAVRDGAIENGFLCGVSLIHHKVCYYGSELCEQNKSRRFNGSGW